MLCTGYQETCFFICHMIMCHIYQYMAVTYVAHMPIHSTVMIASWQVYRVSVGLLCRFVVGFFFLYFLHILKIFEALCGRDKHCK